MFIETVILIFAVFGFVGVIGFAILFSVLFTSIGKNVGKISVNEPVPSVKNPQFLANLATISGGQLHEFNIENYQLFSQNEKYFDTLVADIEAAKATISIVTYIWEYDSQSQKFFEALKSAADRGVKVRLLVDAHGSSIHNKKIKELRNAGLLISMFRPFQIGKLTLYYGRVHRRAYIFDGKIGYYGGAAISRKWFTNKSTDNFVFTDVMYRVQGSLVEAIAGSFGELWSTYANEIAQDTYLLNDEVVAREKVNAVTLSHIPRTDVHPLTNAFWYACMAAQDEITLVTPYFVPGKALVELLAQKARAGVKVSVLTQGTSEMWPVQMASQSYYAELLDAGVEIYEYQVPHLHTKILVIDKYFTFSGSANFDIRSQRINHELMVGIQSERFAEANLETISSYRSNLKQISHEDWQRRPYYKRVVEKMMHGLSEQF